MSVGEQRRGTTQEGRLTIPLKLPNTRRSPAGGGGGAPLRGRKGVTQSS